MDISIEQIICSELIPIMYYGQSITNCAFIDSLFPSAWNCKLKQEDTLFMQTKKGLCTLYFFFFILGGIVQDSLKNP